MALSGMELTVVGAVEKGLVDATIGEDGKGIFSSGVAVYVVQDLQFMMNFSIRSVVVSDFFPEPSFNTTSTISYHLATMQADIGIGTLYNVLPRLKYATPMLPFTMWKYNAYFQDPMQIRNVFQKPFQPDVAVLLVIIMSTIGILSAFLINGKQIIESQLLHCFTIVFEGVAWAGATICQQDYYLNHSRMRTSAKIILICGTLLSVWLYSYYSAAIWTFLKMDLPVITKFQQLLESGFSIYAIPSVRSALLAQDNDKMTSNYVDMKYEKSLKLVFEGKHAHLDTADLFYLNAAENGLSVRDICTVSVIPIQWGNIKAGLYCRKGFPHREIFNEKLLKMYASGLPKRYMKNYMRDMVVKCTKVRKKQYQDDVGIEDLLVVFLEFFKRMFVVLLMLLVEIFIYKKWFSKVVRASKSFLALGKW